MSPLLCCCCENPENLEFLLSKGADPNIRTFQCIDSSINDEYIKSTNCSDKYQPNLTPLIYCCLHNYEQCIEPLLFYGADPNVKYENDTCVDIAFSHRHFNIVNTLIKHGCSRFFHNRPLLEVSSEESTFNEEIIRTCLELGDDPNTKCDGCPILIYICEHHLYDLCEFILSKGANPNLTNNNPNDIHEGTALITSCLKNDSKLVSILLSHGADPNLSSINQTPIKACLISNSIPCLKLIISSGGLVNKPFDSSGIYPLHYASLHSNYELVEYLLEKGAKTNVYTNISFNSSFNQKHSEFEQHLFNDFYLTPLHFSCYRGHIEITKLLIRNGAKLYSETYEERLPIHYACASDNIFIVEYLLSLGCPLTVRTYCKESPLHIALETQNLEKINYITSILNDNNKQKISTNQVPNKEECETNENLNKETSNEKESTEIIKENEDEHFKQNLQMKETNLQNTSKFKFSTSIFHFALLQKEINYNFIKTILDRGNVNINKRMNNGYLPIHYACVIHNLPLLQLLVYHHSNINSVTSDGNTCLHICCQEQWKDGISYLLSEGANQNIHNHFNSLPIDLITEPSLKELFNVQTNKVKFKF